MARRRKGRQDGWFTPTMPPDSVKLMPEYTVELPLWHADWRQLGLSPELLDGLAHWQAEFDANFHPSKGWTDPAVRQRWEEQAGSLIEQLREELPKGTRLEIDLWPLSR